MIAVKGWPTPTNMIELRGFLGLAGYYRRFIKNFGVTCIPLFDVLKKNAFYWEVERQQAFDKIKDLLSTAPVLKLPYFTQRFVMETGASGHGLGEVLMQAGRPSHFPANP